MIWGGVQRGARPLPCGRSSERGLGPGRPGRGGGARAGGDEWAASERSPALQPLLPPRPLSRIVCSGAVPGPQPNLERASIPGVRGAAAPRRRGCPLRGPLTLRSLDPQTRGFPDQLLSGSLSADRIREPSARDAREQLPGADADRKHAGHRPPLGALLAPAPGGAVGDLRGSEACSQWGPALGPCNRLNAIPCSSVAILGDQTNLFSF